MFVPSPFASISSTISKRIPRSCGGRVLLFLGDDPNKPSGKLKPDDNRDAAREKLRLTTKVRARIAQFFEQELRACAAELGGPAKRWPARYGFSVAIFFAQLVDDFDILFWCDWIA
jgi:hypothetical protein